MSEVGTLQELNVNPGDVVECVTAPVHGRWTVGNKYYMTDKGLLCDIAHPQNSSISTFRIISRAADTQKLWRDMTPEEKGALLLAQHDGRVMEYMGLYGWQIMLWPAFNQDHAYRVKPEPKVETVEILDDELMFTTIKGHKITFNTVDGKPDCASIKMEPLK